MYCLCVNVYCHLVTTQLQLINIYHISYPFIYHISYHISYHIISYHIISYHIISYIISYHIISYHISCIVSYRIYRIVSYRIISHHITYIISYHIIYHIIISYCILSYRIISSYIIYHTISYHNHAIATMRAQCWCLCKYHTERCKGCSFLFVRYCHLTSCVFCTVTMCLCNFHVCMFM